MYPFPSKWKKKKKTLKFYKLDKTKLIEQLLDIILMVEDTENDY